MAIQTTFTLATRAQLDRSLFIDPKASISVPSTEKCPPIIKTYYSQYCNISTGQCIPSIASSRCLLVRPQADACAAFSPSLRGEALSNEDRYQVNRR
jgi:hypothetical protein